MKKHSITPKQLQEKPADFEGKMEGKRKKELFERRRERECCLNLIFHEKGDKGT